MTRRDTILKLIVEHFIKTAEPVGSSTLQKTYGLKVSTATIRNEMMALEKEGYLEKTYTSSGRVPSTLGYRYYVENLRSGDVDNLDARNALQSVLSERGKSIEEVIKESCEILSNMTDLASVVLGQKTTAERLASIQVVPLPGHAASAVIVTDSGYVENKTFLLTEEQDPEEVRKMVEILSARLAGTPIGEVCAKLEALRPALQDFILGEEALYQALFNAFARFASERISTFGKDKLYEQPEFRDDAEKLRELLSLLENPTRLRKAVEGGKLLPSGVSVRIGEGGLTLISAGLHIPGETGASLTLVGPSRLNYEKVLATLTYFASALEEYFGNNRKKGELVKICGAKTKEKTKKKNPEKKITKKTTKGN